jgi:hypothetical protein
MSNKEQPNDAFTNVFGIAGFILGFGVGWQFSGSLLGAFIGALILAVLGAAIGKTIYKILLFGVCLLAFFIRRAVTKEVFKTVTSTETPSSPRPHSFLPPSSSSRLFPKTSTPSPTAGHSLYLKNECSKTIRLALSYRTSDNEWKTDGWWTWEGKKSQFLYTNNKRIQLTSSEVYVYAYIMGSEYTWEGSDQREFGGRDLSMRKFSLSTDNAGDYILSLNCNNLDTILNLEKDKMLSRRANGGYRLGITGTDLHPCLVDGTSTNGILVTIVGDDSPAATAGIQPGDIIYRLDERNIGTISWLSMYLDTKNNPREDVHIYYLRQGELRDVTVTPVYHE